MVFDDVWDDVTGGVFCSGVVRTPFTLNLPVGQEIITDHERLVTLSIYPGTAFCWLWGSAGFFLCRLGL